MVKEGVDFKAFFNRNVVMFEKGGAEKEVEAEGICVAADFRFAEFELMACTVNFLFCDSSLHNFLKGRKDERFDGVEVRGFDAF